VGRCHYELIDKPLQLVELQINRHDASWRGII